jgi:hypothetical protein
VTCEDEEIDGLLEAVLDRGHNSKALVALAWRKGGSYIEEADRKAHCHSYLVNLISAHWGQLKYLEGSYIPETCRLECLPMLRAIHRQMPAGFPDYDSSASYSVRKGQIEAMKEWFRAKRSRLIWDAANGKYRLGEYENETR